jgi:hypothetical protein
MKSMLLITTLELTGLATAYSVYNASVATPLNASTAVNGCNTDLAKNGMLNCLQACPEWCWATVIAEMEAWYKRKDSLEAGNGAPTQKCTQDECAIVSDVVGKACCDGPPKQCGGQKQGQCGQAGPEGMITQQLSKRTGRHFKKTGPLSEAELQHQLMSGNPVPVDGNNHIDIIVGCAPGADGTIGYRKIDSLEGPGDPHKQHLWYDNFKELSSGGQWVHSWVIG